MKHHLKRTLALVLVCTLLSVCAGAADFTGRADELHELGLFQGSGTDADGNPVYNLDKAPTRAEAVTMLVRLLGKETEAKEGQWEVPFTDLDGANAWALPYVGYAYENGLTNGESEELFGTNNTCSAQMYCTLVLRSLGYSDKAVEDTAADFTYEEAVTFATGLGLLDPMTAEGGFLRDEVAAVSYSALVTPLKGTETLLVNKLVEEGAVEEEAAKTLTDKAALYSEYCALAAKTSEMKDKSIDMSFKMDMVMTSAGVEIPMNIEGSEQIRVLEAGLESASKMTTTVMGQTATVETYVKDGVMYTNDGTAKTKAPATEMNDVVSSLMANESSVSPLYFIDAISSAKDGDKVSYTITMPGALLSSMTDAFLSSMQGAEGMEGLSLTMGDVTMTMNFEKDSLKSVQMEMAMTMTVSGQTSDVTLTLDGTVDAMGENVKITFPTDLDTYVDAAA